MALLLTDKELVEVLGFSRVTLWRMRQMGMPCIQIGRTLRYKLDDVMAWLESQSRKESA